MSYSDLIKKLVQAHIAGDELTFTSCTQKYLEDEKKKNHHTNARSLENILSMANSRSKEFTSFTLNSLPMDKERIIPLVEYREPQKTFNELTLCSETLEQLEQLVLENRKSELLNGWGISPCRKVLFCGPPGCGKTVCAEAIAGYLALPLYVVRFDSVVSSYLGETSSNLRKIFDFARTSPMVILFDEFDAIGKSRAIEDEHGELKRVINSFLQMLDSFFSETIMIAATNHEGLIDAALWRRFDDVVQFKKPDAQQVEKLLTNSLKQVSMPNKRTLKQCVAMLEGLSHADIERTCKSALKQMILDGESTLSSATLLSSAAKQVKRSEIISKFSLNGRSSKESTF